MPAEAGWLLHGHNPCSVILQRELCDGAEMTVRLIVAGLLLVAWRHSNPGQGAAQAAATQMTASVIAEYSTRH